MFPYGKEAVWIDGFGVDCSLFDLFFWHCEDACILELDAVN